MSFWEGVARALDIWGTFPSHNPLEKSDIDAICDDWLAIGQDMQGAFGAIDDRA